MKNLIDHSKPNKSEKRFLSLILSLAVLISLTFLVYAFIKADEAEKFANEALELRMEVNELKVQAEELKQHALNAAAEARMAQAEAERVMAECQSK